MAPVFPPSSHRTVNYIQAWLYIIGTRERARKLLKVLDKLPGATVARDEFLQQDVTYAPMCPTQILFGAKEAGKVYADPQLRPALDAWDNGALTKHDIRRFAQWIERGKYKGPALTLTKKVRHEKVA